MIKLCPIFCVQVVAFVLARGYCHCKPRANKSRTLTVIGLALLSHQLRDALRRGMYLWPLVEASSAAIPRVAYIVTLMLTPFLIITPLVSLSTPPRCTVMQRDNNVIYNIV
jgi:hypothetical protein